MFKLTIADNSQTFENFDSMMQEIASRHSSDSYYQVAKIDSLIRELKETVKEQINADYISSFVRRVSKTLAELEEIQLKLTWLTGERSTWVVMDYHNKPGNQALFIPDHIDYIQIGDYLYQIDEI